jgi:hypothetical protein
LREETNKSGFQIRGLVWPERCPYVAQLYDIAKFKVLGIPISHLFARRLDENRNLVRFLEIRPVPENLMHDAKCRDPRFRNHMIPASGLK